MKTLQFITVVVSLVLSTPLVAQEDLVNTDDGYAAEGYDVVAYFEGEAEKGKNDYSVTHDGVSYRFATKERMMTFKKEPKKYIPQYGGFCAYAIADGKRVGINPKRFKIQDGRLYLFYDSWGANTLKKWNEEGPEMLQKKADKNWEEITRKQKM
ncbi:YHS domain-containing (seleno)protein [Altibacter sp. HG106]|uniref:YHS domain-containing (seleno)protein n=1 Tax=Altibacter sp. HG106 TaxID=3023937 RepID=UPI00235080DB|nr:YHS domain-containing (seleno)protein [Altibacter sp. HG106]MDC7995264.1 YHS domain-containing (seleno)protein [Altibacter sp. HG106]